MYRQDTARIKAAMVIYALEQDLGDYVKDKHSEISDDGTATEVTARIQKNSLLVITPTTHQIVEATYLAEVLNLASAAAENTSDSEYFVRLRKIFESLEVTEIRNSASHPNRPFLEAYWYRVCALATDPVINKLKFTRVIQNFTLACEERLTSPPDEWMELRRSFIKNNLPDNVEHELTGLIGRDRDLTKLENELKRGRNSLIALVARGGTGKTALALECLNNISLKPETADWAEAIIYCTLKQERLTSSGVQNLISPNTVDSLRDELTTSINHVFLEDCSDYETLKNKHRAVKLLIVVDNLETLLRDNPEKFGLFVDDLPQTWKVLVTSRIPVESAKNIPLDSLARQASIFLTRKYFISRGYSNIDADTLERVARASNDNPLAIRLIADLFIAGKDVSSAILIAANEIASYSFSNLIDALSEDSILILEGLFALSKSNRSILVDTLEISLDRVAAAIAQLGKTSLISRATNESLEEVYSIDESIRDLLRVIPRNLDIRRQVTSNISRLRAIENDTLQHQKNFKRNELDRDFIPENTPITLIPIIDKLNRALSAKDASIIRELDIKLRSMDDALRETAIFQKQLVRIGFFFGDQLAQESALLQMLKNCVDNPYALLSLGYLYRSQQKLPEALIKFKLLIDQGWGDVEKSGQVAAISIHQGYLSALLFSGKYLSNVLDQTKDWKSKGCLRLVYGVARASAFRRFNEPNSDTSATEARTSMESAVTVLLELVALEGTPKSVIDEQIKVITHIPALLLSIEKNTQARQSALRLIKYCHEQLPQMQGQLDGRFDFIIRKLSQIDIDGNPFLQPTSTPEIVEDILKIENPLPQDFHPVTIYHIPSTVSFPSFIFARDDEGKTYFLQADQFQKGDWANWILLKVGSKVAVQATPSTTGSTDFRAKKILAI